MAIVDIPGYVSQLKDHAVEHGLHIHDERGWGSSFLLRPKRGYKVDPAGRLARTIEFIQTVSFAPTKGTRSYSKTRFDNQKLCYLA